MLEPELVNELLDCVFDSTKSFDEIRTVCKKVTADPKTAKEASEFLAFVDAAVSALAAEKIKSKLSKRTTNNGEKTEENKPNEEEKPAEKDFFKLGFPHEHVFTATLSKPIDFGDILRKAIFDKTDEKKDEEKKPEEKHEEPENDEDYDDDEDCDEDDDDYEDEDCEIDHPYHYNHGNIEVIDFIEDQELDFCLGNAVKYICRAGYKNPDTFEDDLNKAIWYLNHELEERKGVGAK